MKTLRRILILFAILSIVPACSDESEYLDKLLNTGSKANKESIQITGVDFKDGYKHFSVDVRIAESIGAHNLSDPDDVTVAAQEFDYLGNPIFSIAQPELTRIISQGAAQIVSANLKMLVLVDLTLPQDVVDMEREAVKEMSTLFNSQNLYVSFISDKQGISSILEPSEYVLNTYFKSVQVQRKPLFSSISKAMDLLSDESGMLSDVQERIILILSDGKVTYDDKFEVEANYFDIKSNLLAKSARTKDSHIMYYVDMITTDDDTVQDAEAFLRSICLNTGGFSYEGFDWVKVEDDIFTKFNINYADYRFEFTNPDRKLYSGFRNKLRIDCYHNGQLLATGSTDIKIGSFFSPIIVNAISISQIVARGIVFTLALSIVLLVILLLIVPAVRYALFKRKYVVDFNDANTSVNGVLIGNTCYYCKAPFNPGDKVIAKCKHTMHESCWEENDYHCPEFGRNCKDGAHYYNKANKLDPRNAPYYTKWVMTAIVCALATWIVHSLSYNSLTYEFLKDFSEMNSGGPNNYTFLIPSFGFVTAFLLTIGFSWISIKKRSVVRNLCEVMARSLLSGLIAYLVFGLCALASMSFIREGDAALFGWLPWTLSGIAIAFCSTWLTSYTISYKALLIVVAVGILSMFGWSFLSHKISLDYRPYVIFVFIIYAVGLAIGISQAAPKSERYFLHAGGAVKEMDIALYKWFSANPGAAVSIGKSVDCDIEMSWDLAAGIKPKQVEIKLRNGVPYLFVLEGSILSGGRKLSTGDKVKLYHGRTFRIGNTQFTYQERDV